MEDIEISEAYPRFNPNIIGLSRDLQHEILDHASLLESSLLSYCPCVRHMLASDLSFGFTYITNASTSLADRTQVRPRVALSDLKSDDEPRITSPLPPDRDQCSMP